MSLLPIPKLKWPFPQDFPRPFSQTTGSPAASPMPGENHEADNYSQSFDLELAQLPWRLTRFTSRHYFGLTLNIWHWVILSIAIDLLWLGAWPMLLQDIALAELCARTAAIFVVAAVAIWWLRTTILEALFSFQTLQQQLALKNSWLGYILLGGVALAAAAEVLTKLARVNLMTIVAALLIAGGAIRSMQKALRQRQAEARGLARDRTSRVERANYGMFIASILPIGLSRVAGALLCLSLSLMRSPLWMLGVATLAETIILFAMFPRLEEFTFACKRCGILTSRALQSGGLCPICLQSPK